MAAESATVVKDKYKGTAGAITAGALTSLTGELKSEKLELLINTNVASDTLGVESAFDIVSLFKEDEAALEKTITLYAQNGRGMESLDRTLTALGGLSDPKLADYKIGLIDSLGKLPTEKYESASKFLDTVASLGNNFDGSTILPQLSTEDMAEAGKDLEKLEPFVEKLSKIKDKDAKKQFVLDFAAGDKDFAALKEKLVDKLLSILGENKSAGVFNNFKEEIIKKGTKFIQKNFIAFRCFFFQVNF
jgi:hypothetical protein